jgi:hypothetical protein
VAKADNGMVVVVGVILRWWSPWWHSAWLGGAVLNVSLVQLPLRFILFESRQVKVRVKKVEVYFGKKRNVSPKNFFLGDEKRR